MDTITLTPTYGVHQENVRGIKIRGRPIPQTFEITRQTDAGSQNGALHSLLLRNKGLIVSIGIKKASRQRGEFLLVKGIVGFSAITFVAYEAIAPHVGLTRSAFPEILSAIVGALVGLSYYYYVASRPTK